MLLEPLAIGMLSSDLVLDFIIANDSPEAPKAKKGVSLEDKRQDDRKHSHGGNKKKGKKRK